MFYSKKVKKKQSFTRNCLEIIIIVITIFLIRTFGFGLYQVPTGSMETTMLVGERFFADKLSYWFRDPAFGEIIAFNSPYYEYSSNGAMELFERYVWGPDNWTKRVIGVPGDTIKGVIEDGRPVIYRNGQKLVEPYLNKYPLICERTTTGAKIPKSFDPEKPFDKQPFYRVNQEVVERNPDGSIRLIAPTTPLRNSGFAGTSRKYNGTDEFEITLKNNEYWLMGDNRAGSKDSRWFGPYNKKNIHGRIIYRIWSSDTQESWLILDIIKNPIKYFKEYVRWNRVFQMVR